jgi:site-specific DNA recombinase
MGLATQRDRVREYIAEKRYELVDVAEEAASGGVRADEVFSWEHRPVLLRILEDAQAGRFDVLVVPKLDRLSRDHTTLVVIERQLQRHGVTVESVAEERNGDGALAEFVRGQLALVAQLERSMILDRVNAGKAKRKTQGRHVHGRVPYGYRTRDAIDGDGGRQLESVPEFAPVVRRIFSDTIAGDAPARIARALNSEGIASPNGAHWRAKAVTRIVRNPAYAGERYGVKRAHESVVSRRTFNSANRVLDARSLDS